MVHITIARRMELCFFHNYGLFPKIEIFGAANLLTVGNGGIGMTAIANMPRLYGLSSIPLN